MTKRLIIGITGASGAIYGVRMLEALQETDVETHAVVSKSALITLDEELGLKKSDVGNLADALHPVGDIAASIASGSFKTMGMVIAPCSVSTLSEIASGVTSSLMSRAADVVLKERRKLVLMVRETPLHSGHIRHMLTLSEMGAIMAPPMPAFYAHPNNIDDMVNHTIGRVLDLFDVEVDLVKRWQGVG